jgi:AcrR family transcriptional regulator
MDPGPRQRRDELVEVAVRVIADQGLSALTFRNLAKEAGTSTMAFSYTFGNREGLIDAVIETVFARAREERGFDQTAGDDRAAEKLRRALNLAVQSQPEINPYQRTLDRFVFEAPYSKLMHQKIERLDANLMNRYIELIELAIEQGEIKPTLAPKDILILIWSIGDGLNIHRYAYPEQFPPEEIDRLFNLGVDWALGVIQS